MAKVVKSQKTWVIPEQNCLYRLLSRNLKNERIWECRALMEFRIEHPAVKVGCSDSSRPEEKCAIPVIVELANRSKKVEVTAPININS